MFEIFKVVVIFFWSYRHTFLTGVFSAMGAFVPIFILMIGHCFVRKSQYKNQKKRTEMLISANKKMIEIYDGTIGSIYKAMGVSDFRELAKKLEETNPNLKANAQLFNSVKNDIDHKLECQDRINELLIEKSYLDDYGFKVYVSEILDKRFPSRWQESRTSKDGRRWESFYKKYIKAGLPNVPQS